jgi:hypothetical protein
VTQNQAKIRFPQVGDNYENKACLWGYFCFIFVPVERWRFPPPQEALYMDNVIDTRVEPRKEWVTPELKKVDIEQITANGPSGSTDLDFSS